MRRIQILLYVWCPSGYNFFWKKSKLSLKYANTLSLVLIIKWNLKRFLNLFIGRLLATCMYTKHFLINLVLTRLACKCWLQILSYNLCMIRLITVDWLILKVHAYLCKICCTFEAGYILRAIATRLSLFVVLPIYLIVGRIPWKAEIKLPLYEPERFNDVLQVPEIWQHTCVFLEDYVYSH